MSEKDRRILLGRITGAHGIRGEVVIDSYTAEPADVGAYGPLSTADGRELNIKIVRVTTKGVIARVPGISDRNGAEALKGMTLYVDRNLLPEAEDGAFYHADLIGLTVQDKQGNAIGTVVAVANYGAGDILEIHLAGKSVTELIPFEDAFVPVVDVAGGRVVVELPGADEDPEEGDD